VLHHLGGAGKIGSEVITLPANDDDDALGPMAEEMFEAGEGDACGFGSAQSYVVLAYYGEQKKPNGRFTFRARPDLDDDFDTTGQTDSPTPAGIVNQTMRHNEAIMRTNNLGMGEAFRTMQAVLTRQAETIERLESARMESIEVLESLMTSKHERELELLQAAQKGETQKEMVDKLSPLIPLVANKLVGRKLLPAPDPQSMMLNEFFKTLTPEQLEQLNNVLTPEQALVVLSLAQNFVDGNKPSTKSGSS
jgi:hypothetical protein